MNLRILGQLAGVLALTVGLAGCMDITMDLDILDEGHARMTTTSVVGADIYPMMKAGMAQAAEGEAEEEGFCEEEGATLTENADGSATCVMVKEGTFAELSDAENADDGPKFEVVGPGLVKVSFSTEQMKGELGADESMDAETKAMMQTFFEGRSITIRISGKEITETTMTKAADGKSAEVVIPFLDLINGTLDLPADLSATVKTN